MKHKYIKDKRFITGRYKAPIVQKSLGDKIYPVNVSIQKDLDLKTPVINASTGVQHKPFKSIKNLCDLKLLSLTKPSKLRKLISSLPDVSLIINKGIFVFSILFVGVKTNKGRCEVRDLVIDVKERTHLTSLASVKLYPNTGTQRKDIIIRKIQQQNDNQWHAYHIFDVRKKE